jgi:hypothetical protein
MMDASAEAIIRVCGGLLYADGRILLGKRTAARTSYPNVWDMPGVTANQVNRLKRPSRVSCRKRSGSLPLRPPGLPQPLFPLTRRLQLNFTYT